MIKLSVTLYITVVWVYKSTDEKEVIKLWSKCNLIVPWNNPECDTEQNVKVNPELFLVGIEDNRVTVSVMGGYEGYREWSNYLAVDPEYQKKGYGR